MTPQPESPPPCAGVGLKPQHVAEILLTRPELGFVEVHAENYMGAGGPPHRHLEAIRQVYPLSIHGVGLSLGGAGPLDQTHLDRLAALVDRYEPRLVSEHLAWSRREDAFLNDLLPVPYTPAALERVTGHVDRVQTRLGRRILLENPSTYVGFDESELAEVDFLSEIARRTGCGLLLDVNNVYVSAVNGARDPKAYLHAFPLHAVEQIHLAGHSRRVDPNGGALLVDSHDSPVTEAVWDLFRQVVTRTGPLPALIERDADIPSWDILYAEARRADCEMADLTRMAAGGDLAVAC